MSDSVRVPLRRGLSRELIKYVAMLTMLLNHIAGIFLPSGTWLCELLTDVGYFTAVTMLYFLVEGYQYTHSRPRYLLRLFGFALLSQLPYCLAFTEEGILAPCTLNMLFTLCLCFLLIAGLDRFRHPAARAALAAAAILLSCLCDWAILAPVFTLLFLWAGHDRRRVRIAFALDALLFAATTFLGGLGRFSLGVNLLYALLGALGIALAGVCIGGFYYGRRMKAGTTFSKWFCYLFYPIHLLILGLLRIALNMPL